MSDEKSQETISKNEKHYKTVSCRAPVNIAVVKYWGKRDEHLILPINSSLSVTLSQRDLSTTTTAVASPLFKCDKVWINGEEQDIDKSSRLKTCFRKVREVARKYSKGDGDMLDWSLHVWSVNNFPTAAGLASSASGYACLVYTLSKVYDISENIDLSVIARQGSGSACRSMYGGFVTWNMGSSLDGSDSNAYQVATEHHWPELKILILVVNDEKKGTASTKGMQRSVETSELLKFRAKQLVPERMKRMEEAVKKRDFSTFAELTMKESNQFHAICLDTYPPIEPPYLSSTSHKIMTVIDKYNKFYDHMKAAYTFDAGPNAVVFTLEKDQNMLLQVLEHFFPSEDYDRVWTSPSKRNTIPTELLQSLTMEPCPGEIKKIIQTEVGGGPEVVVDAEDLHLGDEDFKSKIMRLGEVVEDDQN